MVIYILWLRQIKRYFRNRARILGSLGQPILFLVALGFGFGPVYAKAGGGDYIQFIAPGIISMSILFLSVFSGIEMIWDKEFGFLKETFVAPVSRLEIVFGRILGGATVAMIQGIVVLVLVSFFKFQLHNFWLLPVVLLAMLLIAITFTALGTAIACILDDMHAFQLISNFLIMPLFFLSGALFPLQGLPRAMTIVAAMDPLAYGVDALRGLLSGTTHFGLTVDFTVLGISSVALLIISSYLFSKMKM